MRTDWKDLGSGVGLEGAHRYGIANHSEEVWGTPTLSQNEAVFNISIYKHSMMSGKKVFRLKKILK